MAVRFAKTESVTKPVSALKVGNKTVSVSTLMAVEYLGLYNQLEAFGLEAIQKRMEVLKQGLLGFAADMPEDKPAVFSTPEGEIEFTKVPETREVINPLAVINMVHNMFSPEAAQSIAKVTLGDLAKILSENEIKPLIKTGKGTRKINAVRPTPKEA